MVWALFPADPLSGEDKYYIFKKGTYKVGRKGCDVIINKDKGVSRIHAEIVVDEMIALNLMHSNSDLASRVRIRDCSKYGTFINKHLESKLKVHECTNKETTLNDGDMVSFGTGNATYRFSFIPLIFFICCTKPVQMSNTIRDKVSFIGAHITHQMSKECTHVLIEQQMPVKKDIIDAVVARKPIVLWNWIELVAESGIGSEIPSWSSYFPTLMMEGEPVKVVDSVTRSNCLKGYTCLLESSNMYKFGDSLEELLEVGGANILFMEEFCSSSQGVDCKENSRMVCVIPQGSPDKFGRFSKLSSLFRVNEVDLLCAVISGHLDLSKLMLPTVVISSSCSTDETIVADSEEVETTSTYATTNICSEATKPENKVEKSPAPQKEETSPIQQPPIKLDSARPLSSMEYNGGMRTKKEMLDGPENANSDVIYSQDLVIRDWHLPASINSARNDGVLDFKRFKKKHYQSGNSFNNLIPFSKYPYKDSDYGNQETIDSVKQEKKRKQMEAIAEDLFNNEKGRRRGVAGSLRSILSHG